MTFEEFRKDALKVNSPHVFKVRNSHTSKDIYRWIVKNKKDIEDLTEKDFGIIVKTLNGELREKLLKGKDIILPYLGKLELFKVPIKVKIVDGKLKMPKSVDWKKTLHLWFENPELYKDRKLVYIEKKEILTIKYNKKNAKFNNKGFYSFIPTRDLRKEISDRFYKGLLDTCNSIQI